MPKKIPYILLCCIVLGTSVKARMLPVPKDSVVYKDTLIESKTIRVQHPLRLGLGASYGLNYYSEGALPEVLTSGCEIFTSGKGVLPNFLARVDFPLGEADSRFYISGVLSFDNFGADHKAQEFGTGNDTAGGVSTYRSFELDHVVTSFTKAIGIKSLVGWQFLKPFYLEGGVAVDYLFDQQFTKTVHAITPGFLIDGARDKLEASGALPDAKSILLALSFSLGAEFPLSQRLWAVPNIEFLLPLTKVTDYWSLVSLRGGITLKYDLGRRADTITEVLKESVSVHIQVPEVKKPELSASIEAVVINRDGKEEHVVRMEVEEVKVHYAYPMLNYIFFDEGSADIPSRYVKYSSNADAQKSFKGSMARTGEGLLQLYRETLNILGDRMRKSPTARITLTGCTSNTGVEEGDIALARKRAETIQDYLVKIWQIDPKRIRVESRILPEKPSPSNIPQGQEENRRVEITSTDEALTDPLIVTKTEHIANPPNISLQPHVFAEVGMKSYRSSISIGGKELVRFQGAELKPWSVPEEALSSGVDSLDITLDVTDNAGNSTTAKNSIKLEQKHIEREQQQELEKFSLILFAFDESSLGTKNERTLGLVAESFRKAKPQTLSIVGYTDELGDASHNDELSRHRAAEAS
ncbi:MAG: OmpA family protein, partial [Bacteroidota bacterium]|nr:OmpA family protein [Bacteroidota bacterium]